MKFVLRAALYCAIILFLFVLVLSFASCRKDKGGPGNGDDVAVLSVKLSNPYLTTAEIDSAFAIWKVNGQEQRIRFDIRNDSLVKEMSAFNEGNGKLALHIFSKKKYQNQYLGQFVSDRTVNIQKRKSLHYKGPESFFDAAWRPWVELKDAIGHRAVVALRPDDPYFLVNDPGWHDVYQYKIDRGYWKTIGGIALAGRDVWTCQVDCADIPDEEYFKSLPARIGNRPWNHISITVIFEDDENGAGWLVTLEHDM